MKNYRNNLVKAILLAVVTILCMASLTACGSKKAKITIEVTDADGVTTTYTGKTDAENLLAAVEDIKGVTVDGETSEWGYFMTTVNGITADLDAGAYWAIYVNGEYGMYGIDQQPIADGDTYTFAYEIFVY